MDATVHFHNLALCPTDSARNLGVIFDSNLDFKKQISAVCRASFFHIRQLRQIRFSLDRNSTIILANSIVHSKLDYCNFLLFGLPSCTIVQLQRVQNSLASVVCRSSRLQSHTNMLIRNLHWLPISERIKYKIAMLTFKALHFAKPSYLTELLLLYEPSRKLAPQILTYSSFLTFALPLVGAVFHLLLLLCGIPYRRHYGPVLIFLLFVGSSRHIYSHHKQLMFSGLPIGFFDLARFFTLILFISCNSVVIG